MAIVCDVYSAFLKDSQCKLKIGQLNFEREQYLVFPVQFFLLPFSLDPILYFFRTLRKIRIPPYEPYSAALMLNLLRMTPKKGVPVCSNCSLAF